MTPPPKFLRNFAGYRERADSGWLALCPVHTGGYDVLVVADEQLGRYRLDCIADEDHVLGADAHAPARDHGGGAAAPRKR